jgi:hypothetical protein
VSETEREKCRQAPSRVHRTHTHTHATRASGDVVQYYTRTMHIQQQLHTMKQTPYCTSVINVSRNGRSTQRNPRQVHKVECVQMTRFVPARASHRLDKTTYYCTTRYVDTDGRIVGFANLGIDDPLETNNYSGGLRCCVVRPLLQATVRICLAMCLVEISAERSMQGGHSI